MHRLRESREIFAQTASELPRMPKAELTGGRMLLTVQSTPIVSMANAYWVEQARLSPFGLSTKIFISLGPTLLIGTVDKFAQIVRRPECIACSLWDRDGVQISLSRMSCISYRDRWERLWDFTKRP